MRFFYSIPKEAFHLSPGKSSAALHIKETEANWKSLPRASYEQRVQRVCGLVHSNISFFSFSVWKMGSDMILSHPCPPASSSRPIAVPGWLGQSPQVSRELQPAPLYTLTGISPLLKHTSFLLWLKYTYISFRSNSELLSFLDSSKRVHPTARFVHPIPTHPSPLFSSHPF